MIRHYSLRYTLFLYLSDILMVLGALRVSILLRTVIPLGKDVPPEHWLLPVPVYLIAVLIWTLAFIVVNVYDPRNAPNIVAELQVVTVGTVVAAMGFVGSLYFSYRNVSRLQVIYIVGLFGIAIFVHRLLIRAYFQRRGRVRLQPRRVAVVGDLPSTLDVIDHIREYQWTGLEIVGLITDTPDVFAAHEVTILGAQSDIAPLVEAHRISEVVLAINPQQREDFREFIFELEQLDVNIRLALDYYDLAFLQVRVEDLGGVPLVSLKEPSLDPFQRLIKRLFDLTTTAILLIPGLLMMALIALAIKLTDRGSILYNQDRIGEGGKPFKMHKFRTMQEGADKLAPITADTLQSVDHKRVDDARVTPIGRILRRTSLDELPQLFNVLKGEMSLVGPRPELPDLVNLYEPWQRKRFEVPQGMTGWWQINGRAERPMHLHTDEDLFYIRNYSLWLDLRILWRTISTVIRGRGAY